jgi:hypothetical protein
MLSTLPDMMIMIMATGAGEVRIGLAGVIQAANPTERVHEATILQSEADECAAVAQVFELITRRKAQPRT